MPPLITSEEAQRLGELVDRAEIGELVERAWSARVERFADSTDMCSLVNAKSGGCAEDCGFCAQSKYAEAQTPLHAMMGPEQILEHARAAEAAGAHRFCMVTQGQGLSRRDFETVLAGARLVAQHTNLKRCASVGHMSPGRARALKEAGVQRVHHNIETAESRYPEVSATVRYEGRLRTIAAVREAGLETCVGGILNLGETGWLEGETPDLVSAALGARADAFGESAATGDGLKVSLWDPSTQLRFAAKRAVPPRPDGSFNQTPNRTPPTRVTA
ncbi:MAG: biotin synthase BioB [Solirubrobacteraceae bacterium]